MSNGREFQHIGLMVGQPIRHAFFSLENTHIEDCNEIVGHFRINGKHDGRVFLDNQRELTFFLHRKSRFARKRDHHTLHFDEHCSEQFVHLNLIAAKLLHVLVPIFTKPHIRIQQPIGVSHLREQQRYALVFRRESSNTATFLDGGNQNRLIHIAREQLTKFGNEFGFIQTQSVNRKSAHGKKELGFDGNSTIVWTPQFFSHDSRELINTNSLRIALEKNREILGDDFEHLLTLVDEYEDIKKGIEVTLETQILKPKTKKKKIEQNNQLGNTSALEKIKDFLKKKPDIFFIFKEAYDEGVIDKEVLKEIIATIHQLPPGHISEYIILQTLYIAESRIINATYLPFISAALLSENRFILAPILVILQFVTGMIARGATTITVDFVAKLIANRLGGTAADLSYAKKICLLPAVGEWIAVASQLGHTLKDEDPRITHLTRRYLIAKLTRLIGYIPGIPEGGWNSNLEELVWYLPQKGKQFLQSTRNKKKEA